MKKKNNKNNNTNKVDQNEQIVEVIKFETVDDYYNEVTKPRGKVCNLIAILAAVSLVIIIAVLIWITVR